MSQHRIRELREARGWSQTKLGGFIGMDATGVSKLESGKKLLKADVMQKLSAAFGVDPSTILGLDAKAGPITGGGFSDDLEPYEAGPGDPFAGLKHDTRYLCRVKCGSLSKIGIFKGDVVVVDGSDDAVKARAPLAAVHVQYHPDPENFAHAVTLLRQWVPPSLLITNSATQNAMPIDVDADDAQILGVVVSVHRALTGIGE